MTVPACRQCGHDVTPHSVRCPYCGVEKPGQLDHLRELKAQMTVGAFSIVVCLIVAFVFLVLLG